MNRFRRLRNLLRAPGQLLVLFLALTLLPASALVWLGWRLLEQDRILDDRRIQERRKRFSGVMIGQAMCASFRMSFNRLSQWVLRTSCFRKISPRICFITLRSHLNRQRRNDSMVWHSQLSTSYSKLRSSKDHALLTPESFRFDRVWQCQPVVVCDPTDLQVVAVGRARVIAPEGGDMNVVRNHGAIRPRVRTRGVDRR